ncbi:MAG: thymidine kinase [Bacillales bacterium]|nr:thymidine kinase [Bacillales bacterium]
MEFNTRSGWIEVICGPMFAGKSEELIRRIRRIIYAKKEVIVFKPLIDNRYSEDEVVSHNKSKVKCYNLKSSSEVHQYIKNTTYAVAFDEVQFMDEGILSVAQELANKGIRVICAGLDNDFKGEPFSIMPQLLCMAEYVTKLTAICSVCGHNATRTQRIVNGKPAYYDDPIIIIGASEKYEPRCRHCHQVLFRKEN